MCRVGKKQLDSSELVEVVFALSEDYLYMYMTCTDMKILLRTCERSQDTLQLWGKKSKRNCLSYINLEVASVTLA